MDRRRARALLATGLSALLVAASVLVSSAAPPKGKGHCNPRKAQCTTTETLPPSPTTTLPPSTTTTSTTAPADSFAPVAAITSPTSGTTVSGDISVSGTSTDNSAVARVEVRVDSGTWQPASGTSPWSMAIDTASWASGSTHTIGARAVDTAGNTSAVSGVTVQKAATVPPPPTDPSIAPATQGTWTSPEGVLIEVTTAGPFTIRDVYRLLLENATAPGDLSRIGPTLTIRLQDTYASSTSTAVVGLPGAYSSVESIIWLKGVGSTFSIKPDKQFAHEYGHAWTMFHLYLGDGGNWAPYLTARGLAGDPRLDTSYGWSRGEIIAEDYRLLFGSAAAIDQSPTHMNPDIAEPADVPGLRDYMLGPFRTL